MTKIECCCVTNVIFVIGHNMNDSVEGHIERVAMIKYMCV